MNRHYTVTLPRDVEVDIFNLPDNFDEVVSQTFAEYTEGTSEDYTYQDKLSYIDCFIRRLTGEKYSQDVVNEMVKNRLVYEWEENGKLLKEEDVYCVEFMGMCYDRGNETARLYQNFNTDNHHIYDEIMRVLVMVITVVMNYEVLE